MNLTIESEISKVSNVLQFPRVTRNHDPAIIREQIAAGCRSLGLSQDQRARCEAEGLAEYWRSACSNAWAVSVGMNLARRLARENSGPEAA